MLQRKYLVFILILNVVHSTIFNIRDSGAVGDGTTDDTQSILKAISKCMVNGGVLYIPTGTFVTRSSLIFKTNNQFTIQGDGMTSVLLWEFNDHLIVISSGSK
jgi:polygalacturonase